MVLAIVVVLFLSGLLLSALAWRSATTTVDAPEARPVPDRRFQSTPERLQRGRYLVENVTHCFSCHSQGDWEKTGLPRPGTEGGGGLIPDAIIPFKVYAPNISPDAETGAGTWSDDAFVRALRQGMGHDGRSLLPFMPYFFFRRLSDEDLASIIVYVRSIPPVRNKVPLLQWPDELKKLYPPLPPLEASVPSPDASDAVKRGEYLVAIGNCAGCHTPYDQNLAPLPGLDFAGGAPLHGPWGKVAAPNITPDASGIGYYDEAMFVTTIRTGKVNGVRPLNHIMPWERFRHMTDSDLKAIFAYLRTLKPVKHRVDNTEPVAFCRLCNQTHGFGDRN